MLALLRALPRLPARRAVSSLARDQEALHDILGQADDARARDWQPPALRRTFSPGLFIRPHYWSYQHRFQPKHIKSAPALVAPSRKEALQHDTLRALGIDPLWETSNPALLSAFVSELGKIKPRTQTRLTTKTQRRLAKAIRRAKMMGVIPLFYNPRMMPKPGHP